jgi:hypothetical protein
MKELKTMLPLSSIAIIIVSFLNMHFYYKVFGVLIQNYIEISEIVFSLTAFISSGFLFLIFGLYMFIVIRRRDNAMSHDANFNENNAYRYFRYHRIVKLRPIARVFETLGIAVEILLVGMLFLVHQIFAGFTDQELMQSTWELDLNILILAICFSSFVIALCLWLKKIDENGSHIPYLFLVSVTISGIYLLAARNQRSAQLVMSGYSKYQVRLITEHKEYRSGDSLLYVGATKGYYFLYSPIDSASVVVPSNEVIEAKFHQLRHGL